MYRPQHHASLTVSRVALFFTFLAATIGSAIPALAQGLNYVDADDFTNLTPTTAIDSFGAMAEPDNLWDIRTDFGLNFTVFQSAGEDSPELTQRISGLTPGNSYDVYAVFQTDDDENWTIRTGQTSGNLTLYSFWGDRGPSPMAGSTPGLTAGAAAWNTLPPPNKEGTVFTERPADTLVLLLGSAGTMVADGSGQIDVLIDDLPNVAPNTGPHRTWFEGVAYVEAGTPIALTATLDRATGEVTVTNPTATPFEFKSYSLVSATGGLDATGWTTIAGWDTTAVPDVASEYASDLTQTDPAMTGTTIAANGGTLSFGSVRQLTPFPEDVLIRFTRTDDEIAVIAPTYTGPVTNIAFGDFDASGAINLTDFQTFLDNLHTSAAALSLAGAHNRGDMNGDRTIDFDDWVAFRAAFNAQNGEGAFEALVAQVPEPSTVMMLLGVVALCACARRGARCASQFLVLSCLMTAFAGSAFAIDVKIDIDSMRMPGNVTTGPIATQSGFVSWDLTDVATAGNTIRRDGITFEIFGLNAASQSRVRLTGDPPMPNGGGGPMNDLLADFVYNEGANGRAIGLRMTGLPVGTYDMQSWHFDATINPPEATQVEIRDQGQPGTVLLADVPWGDTPIQFSFDVTTPGQVREVIFRESSAGNRARLNAFTLFSEVPPPPIIELTLEVNTTTGSVRIRNEQSVNFDMSYYEIRSATGALNLGGWTSLDDAEGGDPLGDGWDEAPASSANILSEVNLQSMDTFAPGNSVSLGNAFSIGGAENLQFFYAGPDETGLREGIVSYVTGPDVIAGDFSGNGSVENADLTLLLDNWGQPVPPVPTGWVGAQPTAPAIDNDELTALLDNWGASAGGGAALSSAVPEPSSLVLVGLALAAVGTLRRFAPGDGSLPPSR